MFKSLFELTKNLADLAGIPFEIAADVANATVEPIADSVKEAAKEIKEILKQEDSDE